MCSNGCNITFTCVTLVVLPFAGCKFEKKQYQQEKNMEEAVGKGFESTNTLLAVTFQLSPILFLRQT